MAIVIRSVYPFIVALVGGRNIPIEIDRKALINRYFTTKEENVQGYRLRHTRVARG